MVMSFDTFHPKGPGGIFLQGTEGGLVVGDPNHYRKNPVLLRQGEREGREMPFTHADNERMIGVVDMVDAIENNRPHRASGEMALHVLEVMCAFQRSSESGRAVEIESRVNRPEALAPGLAPWKIR